MLREQLQKSRRLSASSNTPAASDTTVLIIGCDDIRTDGISFNGTVQVDGRVEGDVRCKRLVVPAQGLVDGAITARTAHIEGTVNGPIDAAKIFLGPTAAVKGNITYESLNITTGASISGFCRDRGCSRIKPFDWALTEGAPPLPFSLAKATCRKSPLNIAPFPPLRLVGSRRALSMKAVWEHYQQITPATRQ
jgi:cytoskeletal protein CcmA (bactofilin family)